MRFRILPQDTVRITTIKSKQYFLHALNESFGAGKNKQIVFWSTDSGFEIWKTVTGSRRYSKIKAKGIIEDVKSKTIITLEISTEDSYLKFFAIFWYAINFLVLIFSIYMTFKNGDFNFALLMPLLFIFIGYGFTTATLQGDIDQLVEEIRKLAK